MILVTGGTGLVGSHLLYWLTQEQQKVRAIYRNKAGLAAVKNVFSYYTSDVELYFSSIEWVEADIINVTSLERAFEGITHVYHVAALVSFNPKDYFAMRKINIDGTANVVNLCIERGIKKLCYVSSIATLEKSSKNEPISESSEWNAESNNYGYAITKYGAEMEVWRATQEGVPVVMVNPGVILGPGFWHQGTGELFKKGFHNFPFYSEGVTGFVGVNDVAKAMILLMKSDVQNERFLLVSENKSFKEILFGMADNFGKKRPFIKVNKLLAELAWMADLLLSKISGREISISKQSARASLNVYEYSSDKIKTQLNFEFEKMQEVIKATCNSFLKDKKG
ncbi:MAG: NAD-dependent epimerase/dehydratase family protein [Flavobacteriaceae bacterium]|nr:NAD-dependent epimerase/dehydratase family protein [Flavobacteriaceae bacterium]